MANIRVHLGSEAFLRVGNRVAELSGAPHLALRLASLFQLRGLLSAGAVLDEEVLSRTSLVNAVMLASLCARGVAPEEQASHDSAPVQELEAYYPAVRLARLVEGLSNASGQTWKLSPSEAWECVNLFCQKYWGRTVIEEIESNVEQESKSVSLTSGLYSVLDRVPTESRGAASIVTAIFNDLHNIRKRLLEHLRKTPLSFISPDDYATDLALRLRPLVMLCVQAGSTTIRSGFREIHSFDLERPWWAFWRPKIIWWSGCFPATSGADQFCVADPNPWIRLAETLGPVGKLLTNGCRHNIINRVELKLGHELLEKEANLPVVIRGPFAWPRPNRSAAGYFRSTKGREMLCDICGGRLNEDEAFVFSVFDIHNNAPLQEKIQTDVKFLDYSDWVVHRRCVDGVAFHLF
jgi:hypothetical protein